MSKLQSKIIWVVVTIVTPIIVLILANKDSISLLWLIPFLYLVEILIYTLLGIFLLMTFQIFEIEDVDDVPEVWDSIIDSIIKGFKYLYNLLVRRNK